MAKLNWTKDRGRRLITQRGFETEPSIAVESRQGWVSYMTGRADGERVMKRPITKAVSRSWKA